MNKTFQGHSPNIAPDAFIAETAMLIGKVTVGARSSIWYGTVLRGDLDAIEVGEGTSVQDNAVVHCEAGSPVHIGNNVTVGHGAIVHGSTIGDNCLIGMGSVVLNGCTIGDNCIIAAGAVVKENAVIPAGSMVVGVPGKIIREISPEQRERMAKESTYVRLSRSYLKEETAE